MPPESVEQNLSALTPDEAGRLGIQKLPGTLDEALRYLSESTFAEKILGNHIIREFVREKETEWNEYMMQVSDWELDRYLSKF